MSWKFFSLEEFACKHCGVNLIQESFVDKLDTLREAFGKPLKVNSGYRCPEHNNAVSTTGLHGPHTTGRAVDFQLSGADAFDLMKVAFHLNIFMGVGVNQKGVQSSRFVHIDDLLTPSRPGVWSY